jgi:hypothetical protein
MLRALLPWVSPAVPAVAAAAAAANAQGEFMDGCRALAAAASVHRADGFERAGACESAPPILNAIPPSLVNGREIHEKGSLEELALFSSQIVDGLHLRAALSPPVAGLGVPSGLLGLVKDLTCCVLGRDSQATFKFDDMSWRAAAGDVLLDMWVELLDTSRCAPPPRAHVMAPK